jgi:two-component system response regulator HydG
VCFIQDRKPENAKVHTGEERRKLCSYFEKRFSSPGSHNPTHYLTPNILLAKVDKKTPEFVSINRYEIKKRQLLDALEKAGGNQSEATRILGVSRVTVWNRIKKFNINLRREIGASIS